ncbi:MAG: YgiQ family radical SAM protein [Phycisphaerales bacterium]|nr:MAG: YgiQ family radical SAM protein [Phycisphaerales bacterium]
MMQSPQCHPDSPSPGAPRPLPMSPREMRDRGWSEIDVVFVTGDAYVDHPSFAAAMLGRVLESAGFRVAVLAQPDWRSCRPWRRFGRPNLFFAVSTGNMDSLINHYTANRKVRNDDAYSPGGRIGRRPDRAALAYCHRAREAHRGVPVVAGGVEASLRRLAHYDYWSDTVRRSIVLDSKADLVVYGMGEDAILEIARRLADGQSPRDLRDMRGVAYAVGKSETPPSGDDVVVIPSYEDIKADKHAFAEATRLAHRETNPHNARTVVQYHADQAVVVNPPRLPASTEDMDRYYDLPFTRLPHPSYTEPIPAHAMIKDSVTILRGCFGGCTFCSITAHQGRIIQSRSKQSIVREVRRMVKDPDFSGVISDIGGPTANMYRMGCSRPEIERTCRRLSCVHPEICKLLDTDHTPLIDLMRTVRKQKGVASVFVASGVRMDLACRSPKYIRELAGHHVGGHLSVAPEHTDPATLNIMKKPPVASFERFAKAFEAESKKAGKKQYLAPYFIASHPGSDLAAMIDLAVYLKRSGCRPEQVQDFIPAPMDVATCMYYTGIDPFTKKPVPVARRLRDRRLQRALAQFFKPENYFLAREALLKAGRSDLIGYGADALILPKPPPGAGRAPRAPSAPARRSGSARTTPTGTGYRPHRKTARRRKRP